MAVFSASVFKSTVYKTGDVPPPVVIAGGHFIPESQLKRKLRGGNLVIYETEPEAIVEIEGIIEQIEAIAQEAPKPASKPFIKSNKDDGLLATAVSLREIAEQLEKIKRQRRDEEEEFLIKILLSIH